MTDGQKLFAAVKDVIGLIPQYVILTTLTVNQAVKSMNLTMKRMKPKLHTNLGTFLPTEMNGSSILVMGFKRVSVAIASYSGRGCSWVEIKACDNAWVQINKNIKVYVTSLLFQIIEMALTCTTFKVGVTVRQSCRSFKKHRATNHCDKLDNQLFYAMFSLYQVAFAPAPKPYRIGLLFTGKNGDFGAISVTRRSRAGESDRRGVRTIPDTFSCRYPASRVRTDVSLFQAFR